MKLERPPILLKKSNPAFAYRLRTGRRASVWRKEGGGGWGIFVQKRFKLRSAIATNLDIII